MSTSALLILEFSCLLNRHDGLDFHSFSAHAGLLLLVEPPREVEASHSMSGSDGGSGYAVFGGGGDDGGGVWARTRAQYLV